MMKLLAICTLASALEGAAYEGELRLEDGKLRRILGELYQQGDTVFQPAADAQHIPAGVVGGFAGGMTVAAAAPGATLIPGGVPAAAFTTPAMVHHAMFFFGCSKVVAVKICYSMALFFGGVPGIVIGGGLVLVGAPLYRSWKIARDTNAKLSQTKSVALEFPNGQSFITHINMKTEIGQLNEAVECIRQLSQEDNDIPRIADGDLQCTVQRPSSHPLLSMSLRKHTLAAVPLREAPLREDYYGRRAPQREEGCLYSQIRDGETIKVLSPEAVVRKQEEIAELANQQWVADMKVEEQVAAAETIRCQEAFYRGNQEWDAFMSGGL